MAFCTYCGNKVDDGVKFCPSCGAKLDAGQTVSEPEAQTPESQTPEAQTEEAQQRDAAPPQQTSEQTYQPQEGGGAENNAAAQAPKQKKPVNKKLLFIIIGGAALAVIAAIVLLIVFGVFGSNDGSGVTGRYTAVSATASGEPASLDGEWIELKNGGKGTIYMGYEFDLDWKLDGEKFSGTVSYMGFGDECSGTLKDNVLTVNYGDYTYVMVKDGSGAVVPESTETAAQTGMSGYYTIYSMTMSGKELSREDIESAGMAEDTYLQLNPDGTGTLALSGETPDAITYDSSAGTITYDTGETLTFTEVGGTVVVNFDAQDMTIVFAPVDALDDEAADTDGTAYTEDSADTDEAADTDGTFVSPTAEITIPSRWYGTVRYYDFSGGSDEEVKDIWGEFDSDSDGNAYFELYEVPIDQITDDTGAVMSMYIIEDPQQLIPDIGNEDAWLLDMYLTGDDVYDYKVSLKNGALDLTVPYVGSDGSCTCEFFIREDGAPWDEENDPLPPGYEDYKTSLTEASS